MKLPSLFKKPIHQRFHIVPRYYDPEKEEREERYARIKNEVESAQSDSHSSHPSRLRGSFSRRSKNTSGVSVLQLFLVILLLGTFVGYLYYGNDVFYLYLIFIPIYLFARRRGFLKN